MRVENSIDGKEQGFVPTKFWHRLEDGRVQCDVCPRACKLQEGQRGLCFVRARQDSEIVLTTYGRSSGFCVDPIEKKPLNHFLPGTPVLSFGTAGCNLACKFCQNWDISKSRAMDTLADGARPRAIAEAAPLPGGGRARRRGDRRLRASGAEAGVLRRDGRRQRGPEVVQRDVLPEDLRGPPGARAGHAAIPGPRSG